MELNIHIGGTAEFTGKNGDVPPNSGIRSLSYLSREKRPASSHITEGVQMAMAREGLSLLPVRSLTGGATGGMHLRPRTRAVTHRYDRGSFGRGAFCGVSASGGSRRKTRAESNDHKWISEHERSDVGPNDRFSGLDSRTRTSSERFDRMDRICSNPRAT